MWLIPQETFKKKKSVLLNCVCTVAHRRGCKANDNGVVNGITVLAQSYSHGGVLIRFWLKQRRSTFVGGSGWFNWYQVKRFPSGMSQVSHHVAQKIIQPWGSKEATFSEERARFPIG